MKYYAVTDDPNELAHWGIKGMKWGVRHDKPRHPGSRRHRSAAYRKAQAKLSSSMRNGIKKVEAKWKAYNSPKAKEERFMKKAIEKARTGTLKYGKLTDEQVRRVTDRLYLESQARHLGSTENPRFGKRLRSSISEGVIRGVGGYVEERFKGRGRTDAEFAAERRREKRNAKSSVQARRARNAVNQEYYEEAAKRGYNPYVSAVKAGRRPRLQTNSERARQLQAWTASNEKEKERAKRQNAYYDSRIRTMSVERAKRTFGSNNTGPGTSQNPSPIPTVSTTSHVLLGADGLPISSNHKKPGGKRN